MPWGFYTRISPIYVYLFRNVSFFQKKKKTIFSLEIIFLKKTLTFQNFYSLTPVFNSVTAASAVLRETISLNSRQWAYLYKMLLHSSNEYCIVATVQ